MTEMTGQATETQTGARRKVLCVVGTRPECIKMAPVIQALRREAWCDVRVVSTGQHRELAAQTLGIFGICPDIDLDLMQVNQTLSGLSARILQGFDAVLDREQPDLVLTQGDTTTVMACSVACFHRRVPVGHVEAGLRTNDLCSPFPEEFNRRVAGIASSIHFAPTGRAADNLRREGVVPSRIHITGNTVIDALLSVASRENLAFPIAIPLSQRLVFLTAHRRENFGEPLRRICRAVAQIVQTFPDVVVVYPVHPNPNVRATVYSELPGHPRIHLIDPVDYLGLVALLKRCEFILTDSGGIQEEAPALGKPVLVLRSETERPEAVEAGVAKLVGTDSDAIIAEAGRLLTDRSYYESLSQGTSPYGDGLASVRIASLCRDFFNDLR